MKTKKIALVVDSDNWAFANIARNIKKNIKKYDFEIIPITYLDNNLVKVYLYAEDFDLIHFFWRENIVFLTNKNWNWYIRTLTLTMDDFLEKFVNNKIITTCVYDHLFSEGNAIKKTREIFSKCKRYYVSSNILYDIYANKLNLKNKPTCVITDGVDFEEFYPINEKRFQNIKNRNLVIGWVGNSAWKNDIDDFKGVNTILKPAIKELQEEGIKIEEYFADRQVRMIPHNKMVEYYSKIDVLICTSKCEGTPNPVLEAMACGVPIISTRVGIVPDALGPEQSKYILKERSKDCLKQTIKEFINNLDSLEELRKENKRQIKNWEWKKIAKKFQKFFDDAFLEKEKEDSANIE